MTTYTTDHSLPIIEPAVDKVNELAADMNELSRAADLALTAEGARAEGAAKFTRPALADGTDLNTVKESAVYSIGPGTAGSLVNLPSGFTDSGSLTVTSNGHATLPVVVQILEGNNVSGSWRRATGSATNQTFAAWEKLHTADAGKAAAGVQRSALIGAFKARRGGAIGTNGKPVVVLRFDHGLDAWFSKVYPLLQTHRMPWMMAAYSNMITASESGVRTWAELRTAAINNGGEIAVHSQTHQDATTEPAIFNEVVASLNAMKSSLPGLPLEQWVPPGVADGPFPAGYRGYQPVSTEAHYYDTYAGRLILQNYAVATGYIPGIYRPLPSSMAVGQVHAVLDAQTPAWVEGVVRGLISSGPNGLVLMLHPALLDGVGNMTATQFGEVLAYLAGRRDAGEIEILTHSGMYAADPGADRRDTMVFNGGFRDGLNGWLNTTGWTVNTTGPIIYATTTTGTPLTQDISYARKEQTLGGTRELVYRVRATAEAVVRTNAIGTGVDARKEHTLTASTAWREVRQHVTVPLDFTGNLTLAVGRVSGGAVDITDVRLRSI